MRDLFLSELRRFARPALIVAVLNLVALFMLSRFWELMQIRWQAQALVLFIYFLASLGLGLYQFGTYRQPNRWIWLMHRPLPRSRLAAAICTASALLIAFAIGLPGWITLAGTQLFSTRVVDVHHYAVFAYAVLFAWSGWLCAAYMMLNRSLLGAAVLALPFMLMAHLTSVYPLLLAGAVSAALLFAMVYVAMKPNRAEAPRTAGAVIATALPLQLAFYFVVLWAGSLAYQYGCMIAGTHPLSSGVPPAGGAIEATRAKPAARMAMGLKASGDPRAEHWLRQLPLLKMEEKHIIFDYYPVHAELAPGGMTSFDDPGNGLAWTYSHDARAFVARRTYTGERTAVMASQELPHLPGAGEDGDGRPGVVRHAILAYDAKSQAWRTNLRLREDEILLSPAILWPWESALTRPFVLTNKRLVAVQAETPGKPALREVFGVPLPLPAEELQRVDLTRLADGVLASFVSGRHMPDGVPSGEQVLMFIDADGKADVVARRMLKHDFPLLFEHKEWWLSPVLHAVSNLPGHLLGSTTVLPFSQYSVPRPPAVWMTALAAAALSGLAAWFWLQRTSASPRRRAAWIAACVLLGLPSFFCMAVIEARTRAPLRSPLMAAAT